jgi:hypothetical protein
MRGELELLEERLFHRCLSVATMMASHRALNKETGEIPDWIRYQHVWPPVQRPLVGPIKRPCPREWAQIMNHPDVIFRGTARANQIAEQMQVERKEDEQPTLPSAHTRQAGHGHHDQSAEQAVKEEMMVHRIPLADTSPEQVVRDIYGNTETIDVWRNPSKAYPQTLTPVLSAAFGHGPTGEEMSDRAHAIKPDRKSYFCSKRKSSLRFPVPNPQAG